jgi:polyadenylate-binding protein
MFLGSKVNLTFKDPSMNYTSTTSGAKTLVVKHIPLGVTSLDFYDIVKRYGRILSCKVLMDRSGTESYGLLQFENQDHAERCLGEMNGGNFRGNTM